ncbi:unnamed protein product [Adineta steineri]|uniref:Protein kinase C-binding protein 1 n=2 Tax=Adineta steineri TaxID=433720 RepID=A0A814DMB2_9BILA|nr:unnamed protein product [Adineta steineri]CAF0964314.1 unnamed protein product [Adineta steineri]
MASATNNQMEADADYIPPVKLRKTTNEDDHNDLYCFECHDEGDVICCDSCPRVYHPKCLSLTTLPDGDWTCPECKITQSPFNITNHSMNEFHTMLKYAVRRMKSHPQATPFMRPVDSKQMPEYLDYIIHPMDLETIDKNIDLKKYTSTDAFIADVKWITHNSQSKFTAVARALLKIARHEMIEIEICSECYLRSAQPLSTDWFAEPCKIPHTLCWAKMKGYQPWPAKVLRVVSDEVDVRFFGQHDRAWVSINNCFILSKEYPGLEKKKTNVNFEKSLTELQSHIDKLKTIYGHFNYAPLQTPLSKVKPFKFVSIIDDSIPPTYMTIGNNNNTLRSSVKCVKQARSPTLQPTTESAINTKTATKRSNENSQEQQESVKRARVSSRTTDDTNTNSNRIVLRIRKPSEDLSSGRSETSNCSSNHPLTIQIKEPLLALKEDEEEQTESQLINVFEIFDQTSDPSKNDDEMSCVSPKNQICSPSSDTKLQSYTLINEYIDPNAEDVRLSMNALLDAVDALKSISEVRTNESLLTTTTSSTNESRPVQLQFAERRTTTKQPRKSRLQHRIITSQPKPLPLPPPTTNVSLPSFEQHINEQSLSPTPANMPLRPLSISPASADIFEDIATSTIDDLITQHQPLERTKSIETLSVKSEPIDNEEHKKSRVIQPIPSTQSSTPSSSTMSTKSFLISPPANTHHHHKTKTPIPPLTTTSNSHFPAMIPNSNNTFAPRTSSTASQKPNWPTPPLPMSSSTRQPPNTAHKRPAPPLYPPTAQRNSNNNNPSKTRITPPTSLQPQSFDVFSVNTPVQRRPNGIPHPSLPSNTPPLPNRNPVRMPQFNNHLIRPPIEDIQTPGEIQIIIKSFNDKFQQLLTDFTVKIETALESNRVKYEKELEETRRTYRMSMNELRTITTQQVQEMHNSLELQYWTRLSEMRNRYESTLQQHTKPSKQMNGGPLLFFRYLLTIFLV